MLRRAALVTTPFNVLASKLQEIGRIDGTTAKSAKVA
jgi:hypothetical protein